MNKLLLLTGLLCSCMLSLAQCLTAPAFPACTGTPSLLLAGDELTNSQTKFFTGSATTYSGVKLSGGTLVVCGSLTLNELVFDSGTIFVQPGATLVVNNAAGLIVRGNTAVYNAGTFQCTGNYVMDATWTSASKPNVFINTSLASWFKMPNQYFLINNPYSFLVNNGLAEFHGIITDPLAAKGSVCLGNTSQTKMMVLYNKAKHSYVAPAGPACLMVSQYSQFYDTLTIYPSINVCLGPSHVSESGCIPWGCKPNAWGAAQRSLNCSTCSSLLTYLPIRFKKFRAEKVHDMQQVAIELSADLDGSIYLSGSNNGKDFEPVQQIAGSGRKEFLITLQPARIRRYYRAWYEVNGEKIYSEVIDTRPESLPDVFPNPFQNLFYITASRESRLELRNISGAITKAPIARTASGFQVDGTLLNKGLYFIRITDQSGQRTFKLIKE